MLEWHRPRRAYYARKKNGFELKKEEAETYFDRINSKRGELNDDELDSVAGGKRCGTTYKNGKPVINFFNCCDFFGVGKRESTGRFVVAAGILAMTGYMFATAPRDMKTDSHIYKIRK